MSDEVNAAQVESDVRSVRALHADPTVKASGLTVDSLIQIAKIIAAIVPLVKAIWAIINPKPPEA